jgi:hypothetical protein
MKRVSVALLLLAALRRLLRSREAEPGLGKVGREDGYTYRYATRRR